MSAGQQRRQLDLLARLNRQHQGQRDGDAELSARIESFELPIACRWALPKPSTCSARRQRSSGSMASTIRAALTLPGSV